MKTALLATAATVALLVPGSAAAQVDEIVVTATKREQTLQEVPVAVSVVQEDTIENAQIIDVFDLQTVVPSLRVGQNQSSQNTTFSIRGFGNGGNNVGIEPSVAVFIDGVYRSRSAGAIADLAEIERVEVLRGPQSTLFGKNASAGVVSIVTQSPQFETGGKIEVTYGNFDQKIVRGYVTGPLSETLAYSLEGTFNERDGFVDNRSGGPDLNDRDRWSLRGQLLLEPTDNSSFRFIADYDELDEICCFAGNALAGPTLGVIQALGGNAEANDIFARNAFQDVAPTNRIINGGVSLQADVDFGRSTVTSITSYRERNVNENIDADFTSLPAIDENSQIVDFESFTQEVRVSGETDRLGWLIGGFYAHEDVRADTFISYGPAFRAYGTALALLGAGVDPSVAVPAAATDDPLIDPATGLPGNPIVLLETLTGSAPGTFFNEDVAFDTLFTQDNDSLTLFAQGDFDVTDRLTLTAGVAYNYDSKDVTLRSSNNDAFSSLDLVSIGNPLIQQGAFAQTFFDTFGIQATPANIAAVSATPEGAAGIAQIQAGTQAFADANDTNADVNPLLGLTGLQFLPPQTDFPNAVEDGETSDDDVTWTLRAAYDVTDRLNVYGSWATGFKASSWNLTRDSRPFPSDLAALSTAGPNGTSLLPQNTATALGGDPLGTRFAGPEETEVFELGLKTSFDWGSLNVAVFDQTIEGFQAAVFQGAGFAIVNAGEQSARGAEVELFASPTDRLDLNFAVTYLDPEFDEFTNAPGPEGPFDASGDEVVGTANWAGYAAATYTQPLEIGDAFVRVEYAFESEEETTALNVPEGVIAREVDLVNASVGLNMDNGFEALLFARNLFDDEFPVVAFPSVAQAGSFSAYPNAPRTYGITLRKRF